MINYLALQQALAIMQPRQKLYELIKAELKRRGHWKNKSRRRKDKLNELGY